MENILNKPRGKFIVECRNSKGELRWKDEFANGVTDEGLNALLNIMFYSTAKISTWYLGLIDNAGYSGLSASDTHASHAGWAEFTNYSQSTRVTWVTGSTATKIISNASAAVFNITGSGTIKGFFAASLNTKGSTSAATLWATALFAGGDQAVLNGDVLNVTYSVSVG